MGFMDKAKQMAEQAQQKIDEAQKKFNESQQQRTDAPGEPAVEYDKHGRPIQLLAPIAQLLFEHFALQPFSLPLRIVCVLNR